MVVIKMKALCWHGVGDVRVDNVPDPTIEHPRDAIVRITASGICGSDLHLFNGFMPTMEKGDILGHEPMGVVVEVGSEIRNLKAGDRVVSEGQFRLKQGSKVKPLKPGEQPAMPTEAEIQKAMKGEKGRGGPGGGGSRRH